MSTGRLNEPIAWRFEGEKRNIYKIQNKYIKSQAYLSIENEDEYFNLLKDQEFESPMDSPLLLTKILANVEKGCFPRLDGSYLEQNTVQCKEIFPRNLDKLN